MYTKETPVRTPQTIERKINVKTHQGNTTKQDLLNQNSWQEFERNFEE